MQLGLVERLGHETLAHFHLGSNGDSTPCIARLPSELDGSLGQNAALTIRDDALHLFAGDEAARRLN